MSDEIKLLKEYIKRIVESEGDGWGEDASKGVSDDIRIENVTSEQQETIRKLFSLGIIPSCPGADAYYYDATNDWLLADFEDQNIGIWRHPVLFEHDEDDNPTEKPADMVRVRGEEDDWF